MSESSPTSAADPSSSGVGARLALVVAAIAVAALIFVTALPRSSEATADLPVTIGGPAPDERIDPTPIVDTPALPGGHEADAGAVPTGHTTRALQAPPADLPMYEGATLLLGVERRIPNWTERQVVCRVRGDAITAEALADWYVAAAAETGWTARNSSTTSALNRVMSNGRRTMTITTRGTDLDVRVTLLVREPSE